MSNTFKIDPIIRLMEDYNSCKIPTKINMTIGVYYDNQGNCLLLNAVKKAEELYFKTQNNKSYLGLAGCKKFCQLIEDVFYNKIFSLNNFIRTINTPSGSAGLRLTLELITKLKPQAKCWLGMPSWSHYKTIADSLGHKFCLYDYTSQNLTQQLQGLNKGDVIILQGPCHNPTGTDYTIEQWQTLFEMLARKNITPIFDCAYIGLANDIAIDTNFLEIACKYFNYFFLCTSFSKVFTIYNERVGAFSVISKKKKFVELIEQYAISQASALYFMPPHHGSAIVSTILSSAELSHLWEEELAAVRARIKWIRKELDEKLGAILNTKIHFTDKNGLFNVMPLSQEQITLLRNAFGIFIPNCGRINLSSLNSNNIDFFCESIKQTLRPEESTRF